MSKNQKEKRNWGTIINKLNIMNIKAGEELLKLGISPILKQSYNRRYSFCGDLDDRVCVDVNAAQFPYEKGTRIHHGSSGGMHMFSGEILYESEVLQLVTRFVVPWTKRNQYYFRLPVKVRRKIARYVIWMSDEHVTWLKKNKKPWEKDNKFREEIILPAMVILKKKELMPEHKKKFNELSEIWEKR